MLVPEPILDLRTFTTGLTAILTLVAILHEDWSFSLFRSNEKTGFYLYSFLVLTTAVVDYYILYRATLIADAKLTVQSLNEFQAHALHALILLFVAKVPLVFIRRNWKSYDAYESILLVASTPTCLFVFSSLVIAADSDFPGRVIITSGVSTFVGLLLLLIHYLDFTPSVEQEVPV